MTKEEIARAKELDLLTYFKLVEPGNLKLVGKEYRHKVHSSLTISKDSLWCWHCIGLRGRTALKYLIDVEKVPYVEAVREINRIQGGVVRSSQPVSLPQPRAEPEVPRAFTLPEPDTNSYSAMAYLRGRCIHPNVLAFCRREGILYQTSFKNHPNCVFVGRDGEGVAKGGSLRGCTQLQFRRDIPGSKKIYPFYIQASAKAETVVLLSHKKADSNIHIDVEFGEGEGKIPVDSIAKRAEAYKPKEKVTYKMIKEYIEAKYGFKVHTAYIAEVKRNLGLPMYDAPNAVEELKQPRKHPTPEKVEAIKDALRYFAVI